jgi:hypothetical protein
LLVIIAVAVAVGITRDSFRTYTLLGISREYATGENPGVRIWLHIFEGSAALEINRRESSQPLTAKASVGVFRRNPIEYDQYGALQSGNQVKLQNRFGGAPHYALHRYMYRSFAVVAPAYTEHSTFVVVPLYMLPVSLLLGVVISIHVATRVRHHGRGFPISTLADVDRKQSP